MITLLKAIYAHVVVWKKWQISMTEFSGMILFYGENAWHVLLFDPEFRPDHKLIKQVFKLNGRRECLSAEVVTPNVQNDKTSTKWYKFAGISQTRWKTNKDKIAANWHIPTSMLNPFAMNCCWSRQEDRSGYTQSKKGYLYRLGYVQAGNNKVAYSSHRFLAFTSNNMCYHLRGEVLTTS